MRKLLICTLGLLLFAPNAAQAQTAGTACATAGQFHENGSESLVCDSSVWKPVINFYGNGSIGFQAGADTGSCTSVKTGRMRYISSTWEYCSGSSWQTFSVSTTASCNIHGQSIGYVCPDGSIFAGFSMDIPHVPLFTTRCDAGQTWSGSSCTGTRSTLAWGSSGTNRSTFGETNGATDTNTLGALGATAHPAASYCYDLSQHGRSDWYLPAPAEAATLFASASAIGNFLAGFNYYWTSSQTGYTPGTIAISFAPGTADGHLDGQAKTNAFRVRCVRRN